eukprot:GHRR01008122.1.p1 GENE.GHRR01008122.1~~GHRR01008122.1.p1  ORF type:complete len:219 (+),score=74.80 GHRR01008122.1:890-1546(+)
MLLSGQVQVAPSPHVLCYNWQCQWQPPAMLCPLPQRTAKGLPMSTSQQQCTTGPVWQSLEQMTSKTLSKPSSAFSSQDAADDSTASCRIFSMEPLRMPLDPEAATAAKHDMYIAERLTDICSPATPSPTAPAAPAVRWMQLPPSQIIQMATNTQQQKQCTPLQQQRQQHTTVAPLQRTRFGREVVSPHSRTMEQPITSSGNKKRKVDFPLTVEERSKQ